MWSCRAGGIDINKGDGLVWLALGHRASPAHPQWDNPTLFLKKNQKNDFL
jgi:hypothetical protein